jgi:hypothetical protein
MAWHQSHLGQFGNIPCAYNDAAAVRIIFYLFYRFADLVDCFAVCPLPASPLFPINRAKFTRFICPFIPNTHGVIF